MLLKKWLIADVNNDEKVDFGEFRGLCKNLNLKLKKSYLQNEFNTFDADKNGTIDFEEFVTFFQSVLKREEVDRIFVKYSSAKTHSMDAVLLTLFLHQEQQETNVTLSECEQFLKQLSQLNEYNRQRLALSCGSPTNAVYSNFEPTTSTFQMNQYLFTRFMFSNLNNVVEPSIYKHRGDDGYMDQPLSHYWIASSHNTYLTGHQLKGASHVEMYRAVLHQNCRCVELDCWDGPNGEPIIFHGYTLTSKILFKDVVACINECAFSRDNDYPIILSLEVHCSLPQQTKMAQYFDEIFGERLVRGPEQICNGNTLKSPNQLLGKIILKGIREDQHVTPSELLHKDSATQLVILQEEKERAEADLLRGVDQAVHGQYVEQNKEKRVAKALSDMISLSIVPFKGFDTTLKCWEMHNYSESSLETLYKKQADKVVEFNKNHMTRIYPKGTRFGSSNFSPTPSWNTGCQIVSLNYQTAQDHDMRYHNIRFEENGGCGYLLKPEVMCEQGKGAFFNPTLSLQLQPTHELVIEIVSAELLPKPKENEKGNVIDPYVYMEMVGIKHDEKIQKTKTVWNNGLHPVYSESFSFTIHCLQLAYLRLSVFDKQTVTKDIFICENYLPLRAIRNGYRSVDMRNKSSQIIDCCKLLVKVHLKEL
ncbi:phosphatidylinositol phospholipase C [Acrasis kona]|uniref:Phosphoinositide phospholipase C n=1 Tax=Acrasis kona TaxID=1008807 RepID=A0AAW2ZDM0_9EUKA